MTGFEVAGLILAIPTLLEQGQKVYKYLQQDKKLKPYAESIRSLAVPDEQSKLQIYFRLAEGVLRDQAVESEHKQRLQKTFNEILRKLTEIESLAIKMQSTSSLEFRKRNLLSQSIKEDIASVKALSSEFQQMVMSLHAMNTSESPLLLDDQNFLVLQNHQKPVVLNPTTSIVRGRTPRPVSRNRGAEGMFLLERKPYTVNTKVSIKKDAAILARKLGSMKVDHGVLRLLGFRDDLDGNEFQFVFCLPETSHTPQTLESYFRERTTPSLNFRVGMCLQIGEAVLHAHTLGLVHKNIRPENILLMTPDADDSGSGAALPEVFLVGWQYARAVDGTNTRLCGEDTWQRAIYQHPERQSLHAEKEYCMGHDVYSLGVCMMEIIMWECIVDVPSDGNAHVSRSYQSAFEDLASTSDGVTLVPAALSSEDLTEDAGMNQTVLQHLNHTRTPGAAGLKVENIIQDCITCLEHEGDASEFRVLRDGDRNAIALGFVDTILRDLRNIVEAL